MDDTTFWSNLIKDVLDFTGTISWPVAILVIVLIFRKQIELLILKIKKGNFFGFEFETGVDKLDIRSPEDKKIYSIPIQKPIEEKKEEGQVVRLSDVEIAKSKQKAEKRLEEDSKKVGFKRGRLFQHEENGRWGIAWELELFTELGIKSDVGTK